MIINLRKSNFYTGFFHKTITRPKISNLFNTLTLSILLKTLQNIQFLLRHIFLKVPK